MSLAEPTTRKWTRDEYYQMADMGLFQDQRVELIEGEIVEMAPQKDNHAGSVSLVHRALARAFGDGFWVRMQMPITLNDQSEPEPDVSVVPGSERDYMRGAGHPRGALLVVEVSDTTLHYDRKRKAALYAGAGIDDYWILNLVNRQLEVHRIRVADAAERHGYRYDEVRIVKESESISPLAKPAAQIRIADLLP